MRIHLLRQIGALGLCVGLATACGIETTSSSKLLLTPHGRKVSNREPSRATYQDQPKHTLGNFVFDAQGNEMAYQGKSAGGSSVVTR